MHVLPCRMKPERQRKSHCPAVHVSTPPVGAGPGHAEHDVKSQPSAGPGLTHTPPQSFSPEAQPLLTPPVDVAPPVELAPPEPSMPPDDEPPEPLNEPPELGAPPDDEPPELGGTPPEPIKPPDDGDEPPDVATEPPDPSDPPEPDKPPECKPTRPPLSSDPPEPRRPPVELGLPASISTSGAPPVDVALAAPLSVSTPLLNRAAENGSPQPTNTRTAKSQAFMLSIAMG